MDSKLVGTVSRRPKKPFSALFIAEATRFNSGVAILHIQPVQSLDAPELAW